MFDQELFVREMARRDPEVELERGFESLWIVNADVLQFTLSIGNPLITLPDDVVEVRGAFVFNTTLMPLQQTREILLDVEDANWRTAVDSVPSAFIWRGEQREVRVHPPPNAPYECWVIVLRTRPVNVPPWFAMLAALRATASLTKSDQVVGRTSMAELMHQLETLFIGAM